DLARRCRELGDELGVLCAALPRPHSTNYDYKKVLEEAASLAEMMHRFEKKEAYNGPVAARPNRSNAEQRGYLFHLVRAARAHLPLRGPYRTVVTVGRIAL